MQDSVFGLLSEFYIALSGEIDSLSDEHRWVRISGESSGQSASDAILKQLLETSNGQGLPVSLDRLHGDRRRATELVVQWRTAPPGQRRALSRSVEELRAYLQEKGLGFGLLAS